MFYIIIFSSSHKDPLLDFMTNMTKDREANEYSFLDMELPSGLTDYDKFAWFYKVKIGT